MQPWLAAMQWQPTWQRTTRKTQHCTRRSSSSLEFFTFFYILLSRFSSVGCSRSAMPSSSGTKRANCSCHWLRHWHWPWGGHLHLRQIRIFKSWIWHHHRPFHCHYNHKRFSPGFISNIKSIILNQKLKHLNRRWRDILTHLASLFLPDALTRQVLLWWIMLIMVITIRDGISVKNSTDEYFSPK